MSILKRLKSFLTGDKEPTEEKKPEPPETKVAEASPQTQEEIVEEKVEEAKAAEAPEPELVEVESPVKEESVEAEAEVESVEEIEESEDEDEPQDASEKEKPKEERSEIMTLLNRDENILRRGSIDKEFSEQIKAAGGDSLEYCFQCGTCTGSCPSGRRTPYRIRQIIRKANIGLKEELLADPNLWMCTTCYACQERCPRKIKIVDVVKLARNQAAKAGFMGPAHRMVASFVINTGHGVPINDDTMKLRKRVGLGELPPTTHQFPEALKEVQTIVKETGFDDLIGYNWETKKLD